MFFATSCSDHTLEPQSPEPQMGNQVANLVITASIGADSQTRTSVEYGNPNYAAGEKVGWVAGDIIHIYFYDGDDQLKGHLFFAANSDGPVSTFSPAATPDYWTSTPPLAPPANDKYRVVAAYCEGNMVFDEQAQDGNSTTHIGKFDPMKAELLEVWFDTDGNADINMSFNHLAPMLRFSLKNKTADQIKITAIQVRSSNPANQFYSKALYGSDTFHNLSLNVPRSVISLGLNHIIAKDNLADFYMMIPGNTTPVTAADLSIAVYYLKDGSYHVQEFNIPMSENTFLQTPFTGGNRYYFKLNVTGANIVSIPIDDLLYSLNTNTGTARLIEYLGTATTVTIPATVNYGGTDYDVVAIGDDVFENQTSLTDVTFATGSKVESIGMDAFSGCSNLSGSFTIPASMISIGPSAFYGTKITGLTFDPGTQLAAIGELAFLSSSLTGSFTIPATVTSIGSMAFYGTDITSVTFETGSQLTTIGSGAFRGCFDLGGSFTIPASVTFIGGNAFDGTTISTINMYCLTPPTLDEFALNGLYNLSLNVPVSAASAYLYVLNYQDKGWDNSDAGDVGLPLNYTIGTFYTARAINVTIAAVL